MPRKSNASCVVCGDDMLTTTATMARPCCHSCRRKLSRAEKEALGVVGHRYRSAVRFPPCAHCGVLFAIPGNSERRYCSEGCRRAANAANPRRNQKNMARKRARRKAAFVEDVDPLALFERDGWRCHLCGRKCPRDARVPHPLAPTIDHIVPLAGGGEHSYRNTATAHLRCNVSKGARDVGQQLALVG